MNKFLSIFIVLFLSISTSVFAESGHNWEYSGHKGPEHWGALSSAFLVCSTGKNQSPINLSEFTEGKLDPILFNYVRAGTSVLNN